MGSLPMIGQTLGHYRIIEKIGEGGMGVVYRALDSRLGRDVAIKVLPEAFTQNQERLARFAREAQLLASLNHPSVAAIYGLEEVDGVRYLVLELVPGQTLAEKLAVGPLAAEEALGLCRQIAEALEAAHEKGIMHRDLKPSNVKVTPEGKVKVLDFGLAKTYADEASPVDLSRSPTVTVGGTQNGLILGTAAYMSPEQARGKPVDKRSDIWSFGCVLYEALTGRQAFSGETVSDTIAAVLSREPNWQPLPEDAPANIRVLLRRCLEKETHRRLQHIGDARIEIEEALTEPSKATGLPRLPGARRLSASSLAVVALASVLLGVVGTWLALRLMRRTLEGVPTVTEVARLTHDPGFSEWPTWSPDGSLLAFASNRSGNFEIYVRRVDGGQEVNITSNPADDFQPAFSPDGNSIAFVSTRSSRTGIIKIGGYFGLVFRSYGGDVWLIPALGGEARRLVENGNFPAWDPTGRWIAYVSGPEDHRSIQEVSVEGGTARAVLPSADSRWEIVRLQYSPRGKWITFETADLQVLIMPATGGTSRKLLEGSSHTWDASGKRFYYVVQDRLGGTRLQMVEIDEASGELKSRPHTMGLMTADLRDLAIARDGQRLVTSDLQQSMNLTRLPLALDGGSPAGPEEILSSGHVRDGYPHFSPDGRRIVLTSNRLGLQEVWILDLDTRRMKRLGLPGTDLEERLPYWSPDGWQIGVTRSISSGTASLWLAAVDGSFAKELVSARPELRGGPFSPDGRRILYSYRKENYVQLFVLDLASRQERQLTFSSSDKYDGAWSPEGKWVNFSSNAGSSVQIWSIPASGGDEKVLTTGYERMRHVFYSPDGRWIYVQPSHRNVYRMLASGGALQRVTNFPESGLFLEEPSISRDGHTLVYSRSNGGSSLWVLKIGSSQAPAP